MNFDLATLNRPEAADLSACAREPIHNPGLIQPHGCLFAIDPFDLKVLQAAISPGFPLVSDRRSVGKHIASLLPETCAQIVSRLATLNRSDGLVHLGTVRMTPDDREAYQAIAHLSDGSIIHRYLIDVGRL